MAPREGSGLRKPSPRVSPIPEHYKIWSKLTDIPFIQRTRQFYVESKDKNRFIGQGLNFIETGVGIAAFPVKAIVSSIVEKCPDKAIELDDLACSCLNRLETRYPVITETPEQVVDEVKIETVSTVKSCAKTLFKTWPGRLCLQGFNFVLKTAEKILNAVERATEAPNNLHAKPGQTSTSKKIYLSGPLTFYNLTVITTMKVLVYLLREVKRGILDIIVRPSNHSSPKKKSVIMKRKKLSPRKRNQRSMVSRIANTAARMLGLTKIPSFTLEAKAINMDGKKDDQSPKKTKRKYDDMDTDSSSDGSDIIDYLDLSDYVSDEDPDFIPDAGIGDDSLEFEEGDTESDIEIENAEIKTNKLHEAVLEESSKKKAAKIAPTLTSPKPVGPVPSLVQKGQSGPVPSLVQKGQSCILPTIGDMSKDNKNIIENVKGTIPIPLPDKKDAAKGATGDKNEKDKNEKDKGKDNQNKKSNTPAKKSEKK